MENEEVVHNEMRQDKEPRQTRISESRRLKQREAELSRVPNMKYNSPLSIIDKLVPDGWTYKFARVYIGDTYDQSNWLATMDEGWEVVPIDRHPQLFKSKGVVTVDQFRNAFFYKGSILVERPKSINDNRKRFIYDDIHKETSNMPAEIGARGMGTDGKAGYFMQRNDTKWDSSHLPYELEYARAFGEG